MIALFSAVVALGASPQTLARAASESDGPATLRIRPKLQQEDRPKDRLYQGIRVTITGVNRVGERYLESRGGGRWRISVRTDRLDVGEAQGLKGRIQGLRGGDSGTRSLRDCLIQDEDTLRETVDTLSCIAGAQSPFERGTRSADTLANPAQQDKERMIRDRKGEKKDEETTYGGGLQWRFDAYGTGWRLDGAYGARTQDASWTSGDTSGIAGWWDRTVQPTSSSGKTREATGGTTGGGSASSKDKEEEKKEDKKEKGKSSAPGDYEKPSGGSTVAMPGPKGGGIPAECQGEKGTPDDPSGPLVNPNPDDPGATGARFAVCFADIRLRDCPADQVANPDPDRGGSLCDEEEEVDASQIREPGGVIDPNCDVNPADPRCN